MRIQLDEKHSIVSDAYSCWIEETVIPKEGKQRPYTRRVSGYRPSLDTLVCSYITKKILSSDATKLEELTQEVQDLKKEVMSWKPKLLDSGR